MHQVDNGLLSADEQQFLQKVTNNFKDSLSGKIDMISIKRQPTIAELLEAMKPYASQGSIIIIDNL